MYHFKYVTKSQAAPVKKELIAILNKVQDILRDHFTFQYFFIGSAARNMITQDVKRDIGFDFDINIEVNDDDQNYSPKAHCTKLFAIRTPISYCNQTIPIVFLTWNWHT